MNKIINDIILMKKNKNIFKEEKQKAINVLSLFDGISCGRLALNKNNFNIDNYFSSEIDSNALKVANFNHPYDEKNRLGDVRNIDVKLLPKIDLLIGGSPCQSFSFAGKKQGMQTTSKIEITTLEQYLQLKKENYEFIGQSYLFWEYVRILEEIKEKNPNIIFLLENVIMLKKWEEIITRTLGVEPIEINSSLVSAQNRRRLYWTNIKGIEQPKDKNISLKDILEKDEFCNKATIVGRRINNLGKREDYNFSIPIIQCLEVRASNKDKSNCLTTVAKDNILTSLEEGRYVDAFGKLNGNKLPFRYYTQLEYERLQTLPDNYTNCIKINAARKAIGNGWTVDVISHIFSFLTFPKKLN